MQIAKWGNSLAVRLPANLVAVLDLKEGEEVELHLVGERQFEVTKKVSPPEVLVKLRQLFNEITSVCHRKLKMPWVETYELLAAVKAWSESLRPAWVRCSLCTSTKLL